MTPPTSSVQPQSVDHSQVDHPQKGGAAIAEPQTSPLPDNSPALDDSFPPPASEELKQTGNRWAKLFHRLGKKKPGQHKESVLAQAADPANDADQADPTAKAELPALEPSEDKLPRLKSSPPKPNQPAQDQPNKAKPQQTSKHKNPALDDDLSAQALVINWFKAYPGLWISPLILGLLGGWVIAQPAPDGTASSQAKRIEDTATGPSLPAFVYREAAPLGPVSPFGEDEPSRTSTAQATDNQAEINEAEIIADPPDLVAASSSQASSSSSAFPGVPSQEPADIAKAQAETEAQADAKAQAEAVAAASPPLSPEAKAQIAEQISAATAAQAESQAQAQAAADAKSILEERARNQAAAFAQAQANQAASATPPQPAPPIQGNPEVDQLITMQVAIAEGDSILTMGGSNQSVIMSSTGEALLQLEAGEYGMSCDGTGLVLKGQKLPATVMMAPYGGGLNYVRDRSYRGQIQFICQGNTVLAVNHIDMLQYLYSVVGSEVSASWPPAALKAQSVAARSYALTYYFRPAKKHFHIGDTESYQVYKGTISEDERVKAAVQATAGEFISYDGGIVESLYAASDDIVMEAFQGGGMSQLGALDFAEQGYNYLQILGYYYPETSLGRLVVEEGT